MKERALMRTVVVQVQNGVDRLACSACECQIGIGFPPTVTLVNAHDQYNHRVSDEEPPIQFDAKCKCRCHEVARIWHQCPL